MSESRSQAKPAAGSTKSASGIKARRGAGTRKPVPQHPRRTQAVRNQEARDTLMQAAIDVLIHRVYNGLSIKEVASRAGLSRGALAHLYPTKGELVVAATAAVYDETLYQAAMQR